MVLLSLLFGVGMMAMLEQWVHPDHVVGLQGGAPMPVWALAIAAVVAGGAFTILFSVGRRDTLPALGASMLAWGTSLITGWAGIPGAAAAFAGAIVVGLYANTFARLTDRPAQVVLVPGIVMLVPGAFGFVSFEQVIWGNVAAGTAGMMQTLLIAGALVIGLLLANATLPPRKIM
ncbi:MAG: threonine/serine exporter family protein [bacterium]